MKQGRDRESNWRRDEDRRWKERGNEHNLLRAERAKGKKQAGRKSGTRKRNCKRSLEWRFQVRTNVEKRDREGEEKNKKATHPRHEASHVKSVTPNVGRAERGWD